MSHRTLISILQSSNLYAECTHFQKESKPSDITYLIGVMSFPESSEAGRHETLDEPAGEMRGVEKQIEPLEEEAHGAANLPVEQSGYKPGAMPSRKLVE
jgi:hypothetical protein